MKHVATRAFFEEDQRRFASVSGDFNPMHMDALAARRTQAGYPVVHGVHAVLWALDRLSAAGLMPERRVRISVAFRKFMFVGASCQLVLLDTADTIRARLASDGLRCVDIEISAAVPPSAERNAAEHLELFSNEVPLDRSLEDLATLRGRMPVSAAEGVDAMFPAVTQILGSERVAAIAALSTLVGMVVPGLNSIFDGFTIDLVGDEVEDANQDLCFEVCEIDERFRRVSIKVWGCGIEGNVDAFLRHGPVAQPTLSDAMQLVRADEFSGTSSLIIGGSRGIGAATARLLAAGGGHTVVTYLSGLLDAEEIVLEIGGERCRAMRFEASLDPEPQLTELPWPINQVFYFATPAIFREQSEVYSKTRFQEFCDIYISDFERLVRALSAGGRRLVIFYPSTIAIEDRRLKLTEYTMAKAAAEILCGDLQRSIKSTTIVVERLGRIRTDQTSSVAPAEAGDAFTAMLPILRKMVAMTSEGSMTTPSPVRDRSL